MRHPDRGMGGPRLAYRTAEEERTGEADCVLVDDDDGQAMITRRPYRPVGHPRFVRQPGWLQCVGRHDGLQRRVSGTLPNLPVPRPTGIGPTDQAALRPGPVFLTASASGLRRAVAT